MISRAFPNSVAPPSAMVFAGERNKERNGIREEEKKEKRRKGRKEERKKKRKKREKRKKRKKRKKGKSHIEDPKRLKNDLKKVPLQEDRFPHH